MQHDHEQEHPAGLRPRPAVAGPVPAGPGLAAAGNAAVARALTGSLHRRELGTQGAGALDPEIATAIEAERGGGAPLAGPVRADMEHHLGVDLSAVRVHTGASATELNRSVQAQAFTTGTDVFFGGGSYDPGSAGGRELLAHELTHVVQQATGAGGPEARVSHPDDPAEVHARQVGRAVGTAPVATAAVDHGAGAVQREVAPAEEAVDEDELPG